MYSSKATKLSAKTSAQFTNYDFVFFLLNMTISDFTNILLLENPYPKLLHVTCPILGLQASTNSKHRAYKQDIPLIAVIQNSPLDKQERKGEVGNISYLFLTASCVAFVKPSNTRFRKQRA
jgi:hypothetical protein